MPRICAVLLLAAAAVMCWSCGGGEAASVITSVTRAGTLDTPSTTMPPSPISAFPVDVVTDSGIVTVTSQPTRIVSLSPTHTEMLYVIGAGEHVVGTDLFSNYPEEANHTAKIDSFNFNVEEIANLEPDIVILAFDFQGEGEQLAVLGIPVLLLGPPDDLEGMFSQLHSVGQASGYGDVAQKLGTELAHQIAQLVSDASPIAGTTFFHEIDENLYSITSNSFLGDLYARLGLVNIADKLGSDNQFPQLSPEFIIASDPELIFLGDTGFGISPRVIATRPGWEAITSVREGRVFALDTDIAGRWGPRTIDLMEQILAMALSALL